MKIYFDLIFTFILILCTYELKANEVEELILLSEKPVFGMTYGNFSGMTKCRGNYYAVSDKDDKNIYKLIISDQNILAQKVKIPYFDKKSFISNNQIINLLNQFINLDLEAISCDQKGNLYIASETYSQVLKIDNNNQANVIKYPDNFLNYLQQQGLLVKFNAKLEGIAVDDKGENIWLIAERSNRGIIKLTYKLGHWECEKNCVLINENTKIKKNLLGISNVDNDFSDGMWYKGKLFTLERNLHLVCRRNSNTAIVEKCWSFAKWVLSSDKIYPFYRYGMAEALFIDNNGTLWIGIDNNCLPRIDGQILPVVFHFKKPISGWID